MLKKILTALVITGVVLSVVVAVFVLYLLRGIPPVQELLSFKVKELNVITDYQGNVIAFRGPVRRIYIDFSHIPQHVREAFIAAEDAEFYKHSGINFKGILRALIKDIMQGSFKQGGSSITQQLARTMLLSTDRTIVRKIKEMYLAFQLERVLSKDRILELYLNQIYLGEGAYGVEMASLTYFGKSVTQISISEAAVLAALPKAPSYYSPYRHPKDLMKRRRYVLKRMLEEKFISKQEYEKALSAPVVLKRFNPSPKCESEYFLSAAYRELRKVVDRNLLKRGGLVIQTTIDPELQCAAQRALKKALVEFSLRQELRYPYVKVPEALMEEFLRFVTERELMQEPLTRVVLPTGDVVFPEKISTFGELDKVYTAVVTHVVREKGQEAIWAKAGPFDVSLSRQDLIFSNDVRDFVEKIVEKLSPGDVIKIGVTQDRLGNKRLFLYQEPYAEGAIVAVENRTGAVRALVGGFSYKRSPFNRAITAKRQTGSAFKPFVYTASLLQGMTPSTLVPDAPLVFRKKGEKPWKPSNFRERFEGMVTLRTALARSINSVSVYLASKIGTSPIIKVAKAMGIKSSLEENLSMALGTSEITLLEMTNAFSTFPNLGVYREAFFISQVLKKETGEVIYTRKIEDKRVLDKDVAYVMVSLLKNVVREGTGWRARVLDFEVGGKTGTTDDQRDAWFIGFSSVYTTGVWVGYDDFTPLGEYETGSRAACPAWVRFMSLSSILKGKPEPVPVPRGVVFVRIDPRTGLRTRRDGTFQAYIEGTEPQEFLEDEMLSLQDEEALREEFDVFR